MTISSPSACSLCFHTIVIQKIENLVRECIPILQKIYNITKRLKTPEEVEKYFPGVLAFIDSIEQQIPRPVDKSKRKMSYLGKRKRHTLVKTRSWLTIVV